MAAQSLRTSPSYLGAFFRRMRSKLGPAKATTATAHKLAKIIYHMLKERTPYRERSAAEYLHKDQERKIQYLRKQAKSLGFTLVPQTSPSLVRVDTIDYNHPPSLVMFNDPSQELLPLFAFLHNRYATQAARPARHWWQWPRGLAWFQVLMIWSLVKPSVYAERLSRIGDYLCAARGPGLLRQCKSRTAFPHARSPTRDPPYPLFHRRRP
jgi:hypothetical protein